MLYRIKKKEVSIKESNTVKYRSKHGFKRISLGIVSSGALSYLSQIAPLLSLPNGSIYE